MALSSLMRQTVYLASVTAIDASGKKTFGAPRAVAARVEAKRQMVRKANGEEAVTGHIVYTADQVLLTDRVWPPGADSTKAEESRVPIAVDATPDGTASRTLYKVML